jgi:hypothetical protein
MRVETWTTQQYEAAKAILAQKTINWAECLEAAWHPQS